MRRAKETGKVLWAVDPVPEDKKLQFKTVQALAKFTKGTGTMIEPVCVLSADRLKIPSAAFRTDAKQYHLEAETLLKGWMKGLKIPNLLSPRLLAHGIHSDTNAISTLLQYARESGALLIALGTHTRKKWERFFLGSFAETMILKSDVPVLIVNPKNPTPVKFSRILFPTDFSDASRAAFQTLLPTAKSLKAQVILYFKFDYIIPETVGVMALSPEYSRYVHTDTENRRRTAIQWVEQATKTGVKADFILDEKPTFVPEGIMKALGKSKADLIAMASNSGVLASTLMGSVTRQVVRMATVPVWVIHPTKETLRTQKSTRQETPSVRVVTGGTY